ASALSWAARVDSLRLLWYRHIVNFDQRSQHETLVAVKDAARQLALRLNGVAGRIVAALRAWLSTPWNGPRAAKIFAAAAAAAALVTGGWRWRRRLRWTWPLGQAKRVDPIRREAGRLLVRIAQRGRATESLAGPNEIWADLQRLRYGARETWPAFEAVFRRARRWVRRRS
ncbi:MAG: hypothetical protein ABSE59_07985, partial [Opitutaceae bacterium]